MTCEMLFRTVVHIHIYIINRLTAPFYFETIYQNWSLIYSGFVKKKNSKDNNICFCYFYWIQSKKGKMLRFASFQTITFNILKVNQLLTNNDTEW